MGGVREMAAPFVALGPSGVAVRDRLRQLTAGDEEVLRLVGDHLGALASRDLRVRCADGLDHDGRRPRSLTRSRRGPRGTVLSLEAAVFSAASAPGHRCRCHHPREGEEDTSTDDLVRESNAEEP